VIGAPRRGNALHRAGQPWVNGYFESFIGKLRDELLYGEIYLTRIEVQVLIGRWRWEYNQLRPYSSFGCRPQGPEPIERPPVTTGRETPAMNGLLT
jgi:hypothetical protein